MFYDISSVDRNSGKENPFAGTSYESLWANNPYAHIYYEPSFWDDIGLSNKAKDQNMEYQRLYDEYIAGIYEQQRQDEYNSESAQVERQRQAGLNPDLLGIENSQTGQMSPPNAGPQSALNGVSPAQSSLTMLGSVLSFALNAYQGISNTLNVLDAQNITNIKELTNLARPFVTQSFAEAFMNGDNIHTAVASGSDSFSHMFNKRMEKDALKAFQNLFYSSDYSLQRQALQNINNMVGDELSFRASRKFMSSEKTINDFVTDMVNLGVEEWRISKKSNISLKSKEKMLADFRSRSIERLLKDYQDNNDMLSGLILAGMLESSGVNILSRPFGFGTILGRNSSNKSWKDAGIKWNDSVIGGVGKKLGLW